MDALGKPNEIRFYFSDLPAGSFPEFHRNERRHIAAEPVHYPCPSLERLYLVVPELRDVVVKIDYIGPFAYMVAGPAVRLFIEELRVFVPEYGIRGSVIVDYIDHAAHAFIVDGIHKSPEILECTVFRVDTAVILICIRAAKSTFAVQLSDRVDRKEPDDVSSQSLYAVEIGNQSTESTFICVIAYKDRIDHLILQCGIGVCCHNKTS